MRDIFILDNRLFVKCTYKLNADKQSPFLRCKDVGGGYRDYISVMRAQHQQFWKVLDGVLYRDWVHHLQVVLYFSYWLFSFRDLR